MLIRYPKISVVTPSYNQGQYIEETILSVIGQEYPALEYIIIDGGSTDNSTAIIKKYEQQIAYWISEKDNGQSEAINKGFIKATGDIVCWVNSDDMLLPGSLRIVAEYFSKHPDVMFINGNTLRINPRSEILFNNYILCQSSWFARHGIFNMSQPAMFWRRELFEKTGYINEGFHAMMDLEFLIRIFESKAKIGQIDRTLSAIRIHNVTKTSVGGPIWENDKKNIRRMYGGKYDIDNYSIPHFVLFALIKLTKLKYLRDLIFKIRWKGKPLKVYSRSILNRKHENSSSYYGFQK